MKFLNCAVLLIVLIATISQKTLGAPAPENAAVAADDDLEPSVAADASEENVRFRKAAPSAPSAPSGKSVYGPVPVAYAPASAAGLAPAISYSYQVPAPTMPCAKNLMFSCQPSVAAVPCGAQVPYYGSAPVAASGGPVGAYSGPVGAYSEPAPQWAIPAAYSQQYSVIPTVREVVYGY